MVEGINAVAGSVVELPDYSIPAEAPPSGELGKDAFLKLLVAQLKYQDPLEPSSSEEFIATTAQFTVVEKLDELTKQGANTALVNSLTTASALIGREITVNRNGLPVSAVVKQSRIVSGEVSLETDLGPVGLTEIVSVGAATAAPTPIAGPGPSPSPVPAQVTASPETVVEAVPTPPPAPPPAGQTTADQVTSAPTLMTPDEPTPTDRATATPIQQEPAVPATPIPDEEIQAVQATPIPDEEIQAVQATPIPDEQLELTPVLQPSIEPTSSAPAAETPVERSPAATLVEPVRRFDQL